MAKRTQLKKQKAPEVHDATYEDESAIFKVINPVEIMPTVGYHDDGRVFLFLQESETKKAQYQLTPGAAADLADLLRMAAIAARRSLAGLEEKTKYDSIEIS